MATLKHEAVIERWNNIVAQGAAIADVLAAMASPSVEPEAKSITQKFVLYDTNSSFRSLEKR